MPPGPWTPHPLPAGYVPQVGDGWIYRTPDQPQVSDPITRVDGQPFTFQGRVTDEYGKLLAGICIEVDHSGFGPKQITGGDGIFRFVADPAAEPRPELGVPVELWDCGARPGPGYSNLRTSIGNQLTPGDTSTWFFRLQQASRLDGSVVDDAGRPVAGVCVETRAGSVKGGPAALRSAPTDAQGRFTLAPILGMDGRVKAVPCGGPLWYGIEQDLPFRPGTTVTAVLRAQPGPSIPCPPVVCPA
jgi:hypothetical protein